MDTLSAIYDDADAIFTFGESFVKLRFFMSELAGFGVPPPPPPWIFETVTKEVVAEILLLETYFLHLTPDSLQ